MHPSITIERAVDAPSMISSISSAMSGMAAAAQRFDRASARIAQPQPDDLVHDRVDQIIAQHAFAANVATVRTADEMLGTLIDIVV
jgi:flagellar hook protein FlgE